MEIHDRFEAVNDEYTKFENINQVRSERPDLHAFMLLDEISPGKKCIISAAGHDEIYLIIEMDVIEKLTDDQILELVRCGVRHDFECDCLCMFV